jgi:hypothetical protein
VTSLETVSGVTDGLRLYLGVTGSPLVGYVTWIILRTGSWRDHPGWTCATMSHVWARPNLVSGRDQFCTCQTVVQGRLVYVGIIGSEMGGERGDLFLASTRHKRGSLEFNGKLLYRWNFSGMYKLKKAIEKFCSDLLASHRRKCDYALVDMAIWRFFSRRKVMESLLMGTGY